MSAAPPPIPQYIFKDNFFAVRHIDLKIKGKFLSILFGPYTIFSGMVRIMGGRRGGQDMGLKVREGVMQN